MSKQTRKKSSKPTAGRAAGAKTAGEAKTAIAKSASRAASKAVTLSHKVKAKSLTTSKTSKSPAPAPRGAKKAATKSPSATTAKFRAGKLAAASRATGLFVGKTPKPRPRVPSPAEALPKATKPAAPRPPASTTQRQTGLNEGDIAPAFGLPRDGGETVTLADYFGRKLVIFFYPRADTPGCTREAIDFSRLAPAFDAAGTSVLGVSADPLTSQEAFSAKHMLTIPLVSDETHAMLEAYGAWGEKSMYGRTFQGVLRTTVAIDQGGRIAKIWHGVKVDGHADEVLAFIRAL